MKRINVKLGEMKPNPYKKSICNGLIDPNKVEGIRQSATETSLWEQWVVRKNTRGELELAFGHHRLAAAIAMYGKAHVVSVQLEEYTDTQMLAALVNENAGDEDSVEAQRDAIRLTKKYLIEHPEACKVVLHRVAAPSKFARKDDQHEHGSTRCIVAFLGENNWDLRKVTNLLEIDEKLDPSITKDVVTRQDGGAASDASKSEGKIGQQLAVSLTPLPKSVQVVAAKILKSAGTNMLSAPAMKEVVAEVLELPKEEQPQAMKKILESAIEDRATTKLVAKTKRKVKRSVKSASKASPEELDTLRKFLRDIKTTPNKKVKLPKGVLAMLKEMADFSFKGLSKIYHPDVKGGSEIKQQELNAAVLWLRTYVKESEET